MMNIEQQLKVRVFRKIVIFSSVFMATTYYYCIYSNFYICNFNKLNHLEHR